jgi:hypothetical protein
MKNKIVQNIKTVIILLLGGGIISCNELVTDVFPDYPASPTVNSILVVGEPLLLNLSFTSGLDSLTLSTVNNATIELYCDDEFREQLELTKEGTYISKTIIESEKTYTCTIIIPNYDTIVCSQTLPTPTPILSVEHIGVAGFDEEGNTYSAVKFSFPNNIQERRYYEVAIKYFSFYNGETELHTANIHTYVDPVVLNEGLPIPLFSNEIIDDSVYTMTLNYYSGSSRIKDDDGVYHSIYSPFILELRSVSYNYYCYIKQYYLYENGGSSYGLLGSTAILLLYSNIENSYGIFAGYSVFSTDTITPEPYDD